MTKFTNEPAITNFNFNYRYVTVTCLSNNDGFHPSSSPSLDCKLCPAMIPSKCNLLAAPRTWWPLRSPRPPPPQLTRPRPFSATPTRSSLALPTLLVSSLLHLLRQQIERRLTTLPFPFPESPASVRLPQLLSASSKRSGTLCFPRPLDVPLGSSICLKVLPILKLLLLIY